MLSKTQHENIGKRLVGIIKPTQEDTGLQQSGWSLVDLFDDSSEDNDCKSVRHAKREVKRKLIELLMETESAMRTAVLMESADG
jgi:hypothetical protein